ncbi:dipeptidase [Bacillus sp. AGMB 02131]|uniref:Dipeptidase n=1 Tax=Peribacillus faecalis TaxID=2772559 RepID=A0A927D0S4_9BACI|nr:dipeptidase [Peribacillus faecalis]MBD3109365.1 dipeptidase [Peribacillus faecalis]
MKIIDLHCDVLMKMLHNPAISFADSDLLSVNYKQLEGTNSRLQYFAIYVSEHIHPSIRYEAVLKMISIFYRNILSMPKMKLIQSVKDYQKLSDDEIGAVLALEGCDAIQDDIGRLATLKQLGVSSVGLTWNYANVFADGSLECRNAGLSIKGRQLAQWLKRHRLTLDVSHLSEAGFWDCVQIGGKLFASHSNCRSICDHPRNLYDNQITELINHNGLIGLTFVPKFVTKDRQATINQLLHHIDHIAALGGIEHIGFGSDFDGTEEYVGGLHTYSCYNALIEEMMKHYTFAQVEGFLYKNYERFLLNKPN